MKKNKTSINNSLTIKRDDRVGSKWNEIMNPTNATHKLSFVNVSLFILEQFEHSNLRMGKDLRFYNED